MNFSYAQPYIVVGAFIVRDGKILLIQENHYPDQGKWNIPAGKLDFGESLLDAAKREVHEEAGIDFSPTALLGIHSIHRKDVPGEIHALRIVLLGDSSQEVNLEHGDAIDGVAEIADYAWRTPEATLAMDDVLFRYHDIKDLARSYLDGEQYPLNLLGHIVQTPQPS